jgi:uncharacterized protein (TIGR00725 family)
MLRSQAIAVIGAADASVEVADLAFAVGREIATQGATLVCGGRSGVMEAAARGARAAGGHTIGILPNYEPADANPYIEFVIATGMGQARNVIVVASAAAVIAFAGEGGTLSEIGFALKLGRPVVAVRAWPAIAGIEHRDDPVEAVRRALELAA